MRLLPTILASGLLAVAPVFSQAVLFEDTFNGTLGAGWSWVREHREGWRVSARGLEVRVEPGNMWGRANDARNVLIRSAPDLTAGEVAISVTVENRPTAQYEQVDLVWYYDDRHMVKVGQELVDGQLSIVMGREEADRTRTIRIVPIEAFAVQLRFLVKGTAIRGQFRPVGSDQWQDVGETDLPAPAGGRPHISLQAYQGPADAEHWARISQFRIQRPYPGDNAFSSARWGASSSIVGLGEPDTRHSRACADPTREGSTLQVLRQRIPRERAERIAHDRRT